MAIAVFEGLVLRAGYTSDDEGGVDPLEVADRDEADAGVEDDFAQHGIHTVGDDDIEPTREGDEVRGGEGEEDLSSFKNEDNDGEEDSY